MVHLPKEILSTAGPVPQTPFQEQQGFPQWEGKAECAQAGGAELGRPSGLHCCFKVCVVDGQGMSLGVEHPVLQGQHIIFTEQKIEVPGATGEGHGGQSSAGTAGAAPLPVGHLQIPTLHPHHTQQLSRNLQQPKAAGNSQSLSLETPRALQPCPVSPLNGLAWKDPKISSHSIPLPWAGTPPWDRRLPPDYLELSRNCAALQAPGSQTYFRVSARKKLCCMLSWVGVVV